MNNLHNAMLNFYIAGGIIVIMILLLVILSNKNSK